jgi:hypothetical protein
VFSSTSRPNAATKTSRVIVTASVDAASGLGYANGALAGQSNLICAQKGPGHILPRLAGARCCALVLNMPDNDIFVAVADLGRVYRKDYGTPSLSDCDAWRQWNPAKPARRRRERKPSIRTMIKQAEKAGKTVTSVTVDGVTLMFDQPSPAKHSSWDDLETGTRQ